MSDKITEEGFNIRSGNIFGKRGTIISLIIIILTGILIYFFDRPSVNIEKTDRIIIDK